MYRNQKFNRNFQQTNTNNGVRINEQIRCPSVILIRDEQNLGTMHPDEARRMAREAGLDLVEVAPQSKPPVCRIMDYGKFKYEQAIKEKEKSKKQRQSQKVDKEIVISPVIGDHDLSIKTALAKKFLEEGHRVKFRLKYEKRQNAHKELGFIVIEKVIQELTEVGTPLNQPKIEGNHLNCIISPKSK